MNGVFAGLRVFDLSEGSPGALCTMVLGDNGAAVTRIVSDDPDDRHADDDLAGARQWHRSKQVVATDLRSPEGRAACVAVAVEADVLVTTRRPDELAALGLSAAEAMAINPALVHCTIDGYGDHPRLQALAAHEGVVQAAAGRMKDYGRTFAFGRPAYCAPPLAGFGAANGALHGICAALHVRRTTGRGQAIRTSLLKGLLPYDLGSWVQAQFPPAVAASGPPTHPFLPYIPARTKDGAWIQFANWAPHLFWEQAQALGLGHLRDDPAFAGLPGVASEEVAHTFWEQVLQATADRTADDWMSTLTELGKLGADVIRATSDGMDHPQARFNGDVLTFDDGDLGRSEQIGPLVHIAGETPPIGIHSWTTSGPRQPRPVTVPTAGGPLSDLLVLEAAGMVATPLGPAMLADLGARVIKIEPIEGDPGRALGLTEMKMIQGKESIAVDLKSPHGLEIVHRLVERADMFVHNYRPGVPERLGIDYASLKTHNPRLIYLYAGAYGATGPYAKMPAYHPIAGAICGNAARQAGRGALDPEGVLTMDELKARSLRIFRANEGHPDMVTGLVIATSLLMGLMGRELDGAGREMTTTMLAANAYLMSDDWIRYEGRPLRPTVDVDLLGTGALNRLYPAQEGWVFVGVPTTREWRALAELVAPELAEDERFSTAAGRSQHDRELAEALERHLRTRPADEWESHAMARGLGIARADRWSFGELQQAAATAGWKELTRTTESPDVGPHWRHAEMVEMTGTGGQLGGACRNGQHTRAILAEIGYEAAQVDRLLEAGVAFADS